MSAPPPAREGAPLITPVAARPEVPFETPSRKPSVASGAAIYAEKCAACHGAAGRGDGESAAAIQSQFGAAPADLTSDQVARASTPAEWFAILTAGQLDRGMPPFSGSLAVDDRWDVIAYAWSLGSSKARLELGQAIYADRCVACHGATGQGDGPQAEGRLIDLSDLANYQDAAPGEWENALNAGHVPTFSGKLDASERAAVIDYIRSFTYDAVATAVAEATPAATPNPDAPAATPTAPATSAGITINGSIVNGTSGGAQPGNLEVTFYHFPGGFDNTPITRTVKTDAGGRFALPALQAKAGDGVGATVTYADVSYTSEGVTLDGTTPSLDLPIRVYDKTDATDAIHIGTLHIIAAQDGGALAVTEIYVLSNLGERTVANTSGEPSLRFTLPAGTTGFQGMSSTPGVYMPFDDGSGFGYFEAIPPGQDTIQVVASYQLPLNGDVDLSRSPTYPINAVNLLIQTGDLTASGDQLIDQGMQEFQGQTFHVFTGGPFSANQPLTFRLGNSAQLTGSAGADPKLIAAIVLLAVGVGGIGYGLWRKQAEQKPKAQTVGVQRPKATPQVVKVSTAERDALIDQIAALDDAFAAGEIDEGSYRQKRGALKAKLLRRQ